jgi:serine/threonine-protein kinase HipA
MHIFEDQPCLVVERFDRQFHKDHIRRRPQEDMCQALGIPSFLKYEADHRDNKNHPKADAKTIFELLNQSDHRRLDREHFFQALVVFYVLGAIDGHAKNFSVFLTPTQFEMTPIYDVMSVYPALQKKQIAEKHIKFAMSIGRQRRYIQHEINRRHFEQTAKENALPLKQVNDLIDEIIQKSSELEQHIHLPKDFPSHVAQPIFKGCQKAAQRLLKSTMA